MVYSKEFINKSRQAINSYRERKENNIFDDFYNSHLDLFLDALKLYEEHYHTDKTKDAPENTYRLYVQTYSNLDDMRLSMLELSRLGFVNSVLK